MKKFKKKRRRIPLPWFCVFVVLFVFVFVAVMLLSYNPLIYNTVSSILGDRKRSLVSGDPDKYVRYTGDYGTKDDVYAAANALNERIEEEGIVLLKNENSALPLSADERNVTVFGKNSVNMVLGGTGSNAGSGGNSSKADLSMELEKDNLFKTNPVMRNYLTSSASGAERPVISDMGVVLSGLPTGEAALPYPNDVVNSYKDYNDAAIVVISRVGGEGFDLPRTMRYTGSRYNNFANANQTIPGARSGDDHYLQLDQNETDMINEACRNFDKVILIVNSATPVELGFLDDPAHYAYNENIKAALWIGLPGGSGLSAVGKVLVGEVNPSGRLVDTYARDFRSDPAWYNFGNYNIADGNRYYTTDGDGNVNMRKLAFVEYREGIYSGYRYWETRGYTSGEAWYRDNVVYPFGYGLSYTEFEQTVTPSAENGATLAADGTLKFDVHVKNIGDYAGKNSVSLYYTSPYTGGGIEKAQVVLADFGKTDLLDAKTGEGDITLSIDVRDMASYDYSDANANGFTGYELDAGEYTIYIGGDAHCWADENTDKFTYTVPEGGFRYAVNENGKPVGNLFADVSGHIPEYLSRKNDFANFDCLKGAEEAAYRTVSQSFVDDAVAIPGDGTDMPWYTDQMPVQSDRELTYDETQIKLYDMIGKSYDDAQWDAFMNQLTVGQMVSLIRSGNFHSEPIGNIDKPLTVDADGPMGFALFMGSGVIYKTCYYASECVLAATRSKDLAYEFGKMIGNEGLVGNEQGDGSPYSGWYAPAVNLHRSQFSGRNFEYYSEDACLSGMMGAQVVSGASERGVYTFIKHFAMNDQETDRDTYNGLLTWTNEQAMREMYFKPFEMCVDTGKATAMMSSFNRIGTTWAGGDYNLLTRLLRDEWGFRGMVITDFNTHGYMDVGQMIRAGGDINLAGDGSIGNVTSPTAVTAIRRAAKNILYTVANSNAMNMHGEGNVWGYTMPDWQIWSIAICAVTGAVTAVTGVLTFLPYKHKTAVADSAAEEKKQ